MEKWIFKPKLKCYFCPKRISTVGLLQHLYIHTKEEPHKCPQCLKRFAHRKTLRNHTRDIHTEFQFICKKCPEKFADEEKYKLHTAKHTVFSCDLCPKSYNTKWNLKNHVEIHHTGQNFECHLCRKALSSKYALKKHVDAVHEKIKNMKCSFCPKQFCDNTHLNVHMNWVHFKQREVKKCPEIGCNYASNNPSSAYRHRQRHHPRPNEQVEFKCKECKKVCSTQHLLWKHAQIHKNRTRHKCTLCQNDYTRKRDLNVHIVAAHTAERSYKCGWLGCDKSFATLSIAHSHRRLHKDKEGGLSYKCDSCLKNYSTRNGLYQHKQALHKEVKYCCYFCKSVKNTRPELDRHMLRHTGEKPHICMECEEKQEFKSRCQLLGHVRRAHGKLK